MMRRSLEWFAGSVLVYVLVAARAGSDGTNSRSDGGAGTASSEVAGSSSSATSSGADTGDGSASSSGSTSGSGAGTSILDPVPDADAAEDGARIVNQFRLTAGGLKVAVALYDTELETRCEFRTTTDGKERCLPSADNWEVSGQYSDDACTQLLARAREGCSPGGYALRSVYGSGGCDLISGYEVYEVGASYTGTVYSESITNGVPTCGEALFPEGYAYAATTLVANTAFVEGTLQNGN